MSVEESEPLCVETTSLELINRNIESLFSISNLSLCRNLVELNLHANHLVSIDNLASLTSIQRLILSSNHITTIQGLDSLRELNYLNLACNKVNLSLILLFYSKDSNRATFRRISEFEKISSFA